jgi:hypothetical protein
VAIGTALQFQAICAFACTWIPSAGEAGSVQLPVMFSHWPARNMEKQAVPSTLQFVQIIARPSAGLAIALRSEKVILGGNMPFVVDFTSSIAELSGSLLSELMATCPETRVPVIRHTNNMATFFMVI